MRLIEDEARTSCPTQKTPSLLNPSPIAGAKLVRCADELLAQLRQRGLGSPCLRRNSSAVLLADMFC